MTAAPVIGLDRTPELAKTRPVAAAASPTRRAKTLVIDHHLDWLAIAFRVEMNEEVSEELSRARMTALKHGRAPLTLRAVTTHRFDRVEVKGDVFVELARSLMRRRGEEDGPVAIRIASTRPASGDGPLFGLGGWRVSLDRFVADEEPPVPELPIRIASRQTEPDGALWRAELAAKGTTDAVLLVHPEVRVLVEPHAPGGDPIHGSPGWNVVVTATNDLLLTAHPADAVRTCWAVARLFGSVIESRGRRIDLAADMVGTDFKFRGLTQKIVKRSRAKTVSFRDSETVRQDEAPMGLEDAGAVRVDYEGKTVLHTMGTADEGLQIAPGADVHARLYDKTRERKQRGLEGDALEARWARGGWQKGERVDRVEFQLRGQALIELGVGFVEPEAFASSIDGLWHYLVGTEPSNDAAGEKKRDRGWMRLICLRRGAERTKCATDERWRVLQRVVWTHAETKGLRRIRRSQGARAAQLIGCVTSLLACQGKLPLLDDKVARGLGAAERWNQLPRAAVEEGFRRALRKLFLLASDASLEEVVRRFRGNMGEALEHFFTRYDATYARLTPADTSVLERLGLVPLAAA